MKALVVLSLALASLAPLGLAECVEAACVEETESGPEGCGSAGDVHFAESAASVATDEANVRAAGSRACTNDGETTTGGSTLAVAVGLAGAWTTLTWTDASGACTVHFTQSTLGRDVQRPCPAGLRPADPGWGRLLP